MDLVSVVFMSILLTIVSCEEKAANNTKWSTPVAERRSGDWVPLSAPCPTCDASSQSSELVDSAIPPQLFQQQQQIFPQQQFIQPQQPQLSPAQFQLLMSQLLQQANNGGPPQFLQQAVPVLLPRQPPNPEFQVAQHQPRLLPVQQQVPPTVQPPSVAPPPSVANSEEIEEEDEEEEGGGKEVVQLLYVPVETLKQRGRLPQQQEEQQRHRFQGQRQKQQQEYEQPRRRQQYDQQPKQQYQQVNNRQRTTTSSTTPNPVHQPPLAVYMDKLGHDVKLSDVISTLRSTKTISVLDEFGPQSPQIFVGPSNLSPPDGYAKFEIPYLSALESNRVERKVDKLPFFVAPLSFQPPPGYSKIPFPAPHVGSVVVANVSTDRKDVHVKSNEGTIVKHSRGGQYSLPADLPPINPELPSLVNSLQDSRQPGNVVLVPATEQSQKSTQYTQTQPSQYVQTQPAPQSQAPQPPSHFPQTHLQTPQPQSQFLQSHSQNSQSPTQFPQTHLQTPQSQSQIPQTHLQTPQSPTQFPHTHLQSPQSPTQFPQTHLQAPQPPSQFPQSQSQFLQSHSPTPQSQSQYVQIHSPDQYIQTQEDLRQQPLAPQQQNFPRQEQNFETPTQIPVKSTPQPIRSTHFPPRSSQTSTQRTIIQSQYEAEVPVYEEETNLQTDNLPKQRTNFRGQDSERFLKQQQTFDTPQSSGVTLQQSVSSEIIQPTAIQQTLPIENTQIKFDGQQPGYLTQQQQQFQEIHPGFINQQELHSQNNFPAANQQQIPDIQTTQGEVAIHQAEISTTTEPEPTTTTVLQTTPSRRGQYRGRQRGTPATYTTSTSSTTSSPTPRRNYSRGGRRPTHSRSRNEDSSFIGNQQFRTRLEQSTTPTNLYQTEVPAALNPSIPTGPSPVILSPDVPVNSYTENQNEYNLQNDERKAIASSGPSLQQPITLQDYNIQQDTNIQNPSTLLGSQEDEQPNYFQYTSTTSSSTTSTTIPEVPHSESDAFQAQRFRSQSDSGRRGSTSRNQRLRGRGGNSQTRQRQSQPITTTTIPTVQSAQFPNSYSTSNEGLQQENFPQVISTVPSDSLPNAVSSLTLPQQQSQTSDTAYSQQPYSQQAADVITTTESASIYQPSIPIDQYQTAQDAQVLTDGSLSYQQQEHQNLQQVLPIQQQFPQQQAPPSQQQPQFLLQFQEPTTDLPTQNYPSTEDVTVTASREGPKYTTFQRTRGRTPAQKVISEEDVYSPFQQPSDIPSRVGNPRQSIPTASSYLTQARDTESATTATDEDTPRPVQVRLRGRIRARQRVTQQQQESENYPVFQSRDTAKLRDTSNFQSNHEQYQSVKQTLPLQNTQSFPLTAPHASEDYSLEITTQPIIYQEQSEGSLLTSSEEPVYTFSTTTAQQDLTYSTTTEAASGYRTGGRKPLGGRGSVRRPARPTTVVPTAPAATTPTAPHKVYTVRPNKRPQAQKPKITTVRGRIRRPTTTSTTTEGLSAYGTAEPNWNRHNGVRFSPSAASNEVYESGVDENVPRGAQRGRVPSTTRYQPAFISNFGRDQSTEANYYQDETNPAPQWSSQQGVTLNFQTNANNQDRYEAAESQRSSSRLQYTGSKDTDYLNDSVAVDEKHTNVSDVDSYKAEDIEPITTQIPTTASSTTENKANSRRRGSWIRVRSKQRPHDILETAESQNVATVTNVLPATTVKDTIPSQWVIFNPTLDYDNEADEYDVIRQEDYSDENQNRNPFEASDNQNYEIQTTFSDPEENASKPEDLKKDSNTNHTVVQDPPAEDSLLDTILEEIDGITDLNQNDSKTSIDQSDLKASSVDDGISSVYDSQNESSLEQGIHDGLTPILSSQNGTSSDDEISPNLNSQNGLSLDDGTSAILRSQNGTSLDDGASGILRTQNETNSHEEISPVHGSQNEPSFNDGASAIHSSQNGPSLNDGASVILRTQNITSLNEGVPHIIIYKNDTSLNGGISPILSSQNDTFSDDGISPILGSENGTSLDAGVSQNETSVDDASSENENDVISEADKERISFLPPESEQGYVPEQTRNNSGINLHRMKDYQPNPVRFLGTSTSTEVSHETEICYRGRCVKTKTVADQIPME